MLPTSAKRRVAYTPPWREEEDPKPVYTLRTPTVEDRAEFNMALAERKAFYVTRSQFCGEARKAVEALDPGNKADLLALLDRVAEIPEGAAIEGDDADQMGGLEDALIESWPAYARLVNANRRWGAFMPVIAARMFLVGWKHGPDGTDRIGTLTDDDRMAIPPADMMAIGWKAVSLMTVSVEQKNA